VQAPSLAELDVATTGNPEVLVRRSDGNLFRFGEPAMFEKIRGEEAQMCAGMTLALAYPAQLALVRNPAGIWEIAY
jgi:hypothetical protein